MGTAAADRVTIGPWVMALASAAGLALSVYDDLTPGTGIDHTWGALLVVVSSALIGLAAIALALVGAMPRWLRGILLVLLLLGILGTGCAAYFLEANVLLALMAVALLGWLYHMFGARPGIGPGQVQATRG